MRRKLLSILLSACLALSLLPTAVLAEGETNGIKIGEVTLESGGFYVPASEATDPNKGTDQAGYPGASIRVMDKVTDAPTDGGYLTCDGTTVTVHGAVTLPNATAYGIVVSGAVTLNTGAEGTDSLSFTSDFGPAITVNAGGTLTLAGGGNLTLSASGAPTISGGGSLTTSGYTGDITVDSAVNAIAGLASVTLETAGAVYISATGENGAAITTGGNVTLQGSTVSLTNEHGVLCAAGNLSITSEGALSLTGATESPLFPMGKGGTLTLASDSALTVTNTSGMAVAGNLMATAKTVAVTGTGYGQAVSGNATIAAEDAVTIKNETKASAGFSAITGNLTVTKATDVTVSGNSGTPAIAGTADITASGAVAITNSSAGLAVGSALTVTGAPTVEITGRNNAAPVVMGTTFNDCGSVTITNTAADGITYATTVGGNTPAKMVVNGVEKGMLFGSALYADGGDQSGNDLYLDPVPDTATCYKAGSGWIFFTPAATGATSAPAKLVLEHATMFWRIYLGGEPVTVQVNGVNDLAEFSANGTITLMGSGTLDAADIETFSENGISTEGFAGTLNAVLRTTAFDVAEGNRSANNVVHGNAVCPQGLLVGSFSGEGGSETGVLNIPKGTTLTIRPNYFMAVRASENLTNNGAILNNGTIELVVADPGDAAAVKAEIAKLGTVTGSGNILAISADYNHDGYEEDWTGSAAYYTFDGAALHVLRSEGLDFTDAATPAGTLDTDGYHWDAASKTLTLKNLALTESSLEDQEDEDAFIGIKLPGDAKLVLEGSNTISGFSTSIRQAGASADKGSLTVSGTGSLTSDGLWTVDGNFTMDSGAVNMAIRLAGQMSSQIVKGAGLTVAGDAAFRGGSWTGNIGIVQSNIDISGGTLLLSLTEGEGVGIAGVGNFTMTGGEVDVSIPENSSRENAQMGIIMLGGVDLMDDPKSTPPSADVSVSVTGGTLRVRNTLAALLILTGSGKQITVNAESMDVSTAPAGGTLQSFVMEGIKGAAYAAGTLTAFNYQTACCPGLTMTPKTSSGGSTGSGGSTATATATNPDGSTTTRVTDSATGTVTETTRAKDGGTTVVETRKDGTVTTAATDKTGNTVQTVKKADGSMISSETRTDGTKITSATTAGGKTTAAVTASGKTDVTVPAALGKTDGKVSAQVTYPDGTRETVTASYSGGRVSLSVNGSAAVEILDDFVPLSAMPFTDVRENAYCHDAVLWALGKGITDGTTPATFSPGANCTRAQAVTFLWRAMGSPEPTGTKNPFTDVSADAYYYKAVLWAVEKGITKGATDTAFSPDNTVTRAEFVTFLWRALGSPAQSGTSKFTDVTDTTAYYYQAVLWATAQGITDGTTPTTFGPGDVCNRGQVVTFLYRSAGK